MTISTCCYIVQQIILSHVFCQFVIIFQNPNHPSLYIQKIICWYFPLHNQFEPMERLVWMELVLRCWEPLALTDYTLNAMHSFTWTTCEWYFTVPMKFTAVSLCHAPQKHHLNLLCPTPMFSWPINCWFMYQTNTTLCINALQIKS